MEKQPLFRIIQPPEDQDKLPQILRALKKDIAERPVDMSWRVTARFHLMKLVHPLGFHHWIVWRVYDEGSQRILDTGFRVCAFCSLGGR